MQAVTCWVDRDHGFEEEIGRHDSVPGGDRHSMYARVHMSIRGMLLAGEYGEWHVAIMYEDMLTMFLCKQFTRHGAIPSLSSKAGLLCPGSDSIDAQGD